MKYLSFPSEVRNEIRILAIINTGDPIQSNNNKTQNSKSRNKTNITHRCHDRIKKIIKPLQLKGEFSKVPGYKVDVKNSTIFL